MPTVGAETNNMGPQVFFLTPRALDHLGGDPQACSRSIRRGEGRLDRQPQNKLFVPFLTQTVLNSYLSSLSAKPMNSFPIGFVLSPFC